MQKERTGYIPFKVWERKWRKQLERARHAIEVYQTTGDEADLSSKVWTGKDRRKGL